MEKYVNEVLDFINQMEPRHWVFVAAGMIVVGLMCMRGMGTRSNY